MLLCPVCHEPLVDDERGAHARADTDLTVRTRAIYICCARLRAATPWAIPSRRRAAVVTF